MERRPTARNRSASGSGLQSEKRLGKGLASGVPKITHELHLACVVPNVQRKRATRHNYSLHLSQGASLVRYEIQDQAGNDYIRFVVP